VKHKCFETSRHGSFDGSQTLARNYVMGGIKK